MVGSNKKKGLKKVRGKDIKEEKTLALLDLNPHLIVANTAPPPPLPVKYTNMYGSRDSRTPRYNATWWGEWVWEGGS